VYSQNSGEKYSRISAFGNLWDVVIHQNGRRCPIPVDSASISHGGPLFQRDLNVLRMAPFTPTVGTSFVPHRLNELYSKCLQILHQQGICRQCPRSTLCDWIGNLDDSASLFQHWQQVVKHFFKFEISTARPFRIGNAHHIPGATPRRHERMGDAIGMAH